MGRPVTKDLNGINYAILKVNVTMLSKNNVTTTTTWGLELVYQGGAWWFFGTAQL